MQFLYRPAEAPDSTALAEIIYIAGQAHYPASGFDLSIAGSRDHQLDQIAQLTATHARSWFHYSHFDVEEAGGGRCRFR
jgi:hypothetical protein